MPSIGNAGVARPLGVGEWTPGGLCARVAVGREALFREDEFGPEEGAGVAALGGLGGEGVRGWS